MVAVRCGERGSGKRHVFYDAEGSFGKAVQLRTLCVSEFPFDAILPTHVPEISTKEFSTEVVR